MAARTNHRYRAHPGVGHYRVHAPGLGPTGLGGRARRRRRGGAALLDEGSPAARVLGEKAVGILVFPNIVKAGFLFGAQFGEGTLFRGGRKVANYRSVAASYGFQAGVQAFGYAMFFMTNAALDYLDKSGGWELGVGPSIVVIDAGVARNLTTSTIQSDIYAFVFDQKGLMGGIGIQGSKITRVNH